MIKFPHVIHHVFGGWVVAEKNTKHVLHLFYDCELMRRPLKHSFDKSPIVVDDCSSTTLSLWLDWPWRQAAFVLFSSDASEQWGWPSHTRATEIHAPLATHPNWPSPQAAGAPPSPRVTPTRANRTTVTHEGDRDTRPARHAPELTLPTGDGPATLTAGHPYKGEQNHRRFRQQHRSPTRATPENWSTVIKTRHQNSKQYLSFFHFPNSRAEISFPQMIIARRNINYVFLKTREWPL